MSGKASWRSQNRVRGREGLWEAGGYLSQSIPGAGAEPQPCQVASKGMVCQRTCSDLQSSPL